MQLLSVLLLHPPPHTHPLLLFTQKAQQTKEAVSDNRLSVNYPLWSPNHHLCLITQVQAHTCLFCVTNQPRRSVGILQSAVNYDLHLKRSILRGNVILVYTPLKPHYLLSSSRNCLVQCILEMSLINISSHVWLDSDKQSR